MIDKAQSSAASKQVCRECGEPAQVEGEGSVYCWQHRPTTYSLLDWPSGAKVPEGSIIWHLCPNGLHLGMVEDCPDKTASTSGGPVNSFSRTPEELESIRQQVRDADKRDGLHRKYHVERLNDVTGKHSNCRYFVLDPQHDPLAREALGAYANAAAVAGYEALAVDLNRWLSDLA